MSYSFSKKIVVIVGASSGIGETVAYRFAESRATLILLARREDKCKDVLNKCVKLGASKDSLFIKTDISVMFDIEKTFTLIKNEFGYIDCAFNNAGTEEIPAPVATKTEEIYDRIMDTDVKGMFFCMKKEIELIRMNKTKIGSIVNTASISGVIGQVGIPIYNGAKHAIVGITKSLGIELAKEGIRINAVSPGAIKTELYDRYVKGNPQGAKEFIAAHPIGRIGQPDEISGAVLWLSSDDASFVCGQNIIIDGGYVAK